MDELGNEALPGFAGFHWHPVDTDPHSAMQLLVMAPFGLVGSAAENMARDEQLLRFAGERGAVGFRTYGWSDPAVTFGISQRREAVVAQFRGAVGLVFVRRPTGGGIVDHREGWTYALVIPGAHALGRAEPAAVYRVVHEAVASSLLASSGGETGLVLAPCPQACGSGPDGTAESGGAPPAGGGPATDSGLGRCFADPSMDDVVVAETGRKVAGAAMRRSRDGVLMQGAVVPAPEFRQSHAKWASAFVRALGRSLTAQANHAEGAAIEPATEAIDRYRSEAWNGKR